MTVLCFVDDVASAFRELARVLVPGGTLIPFGLGSMLMQAFFFAWAYPRLFSTGRKDWIGSALRFFGSFGALAWSFTTLPVAAKYQMTSVADFLKLETAFTAVQFAIVSPLIALACRGVSVPHAGGQFSLNRELR